MLCQTSLPYANPGDGIRRWQRGQGAIRLEVEAGRAFYPKIEDYVDVGLPFGPKPRLVSASLNSYALRHHTPEMDVGNTLRTLAAQWTTTFLYAIYVGAL